MAEIGVRFSCRQKNDGKTKDEIFRQFRLHEINDGNVTPNTIPHTRAPSSFAICYAPATSQSSNCCQTLRNRSPPTRFRVRHGIGSKVTPSCFATLASGRAAERHPCAACTALAASSLRSAPLMQVVIRSFFACIAGAHWLLVASGDGFAAVHHAHGHRKPPSAARRSRMVERLGFAAVSKDVSRGTGRGS